MNTACKLVTAFGAVAFGATSAFAQTRVIGVEDLDERIEDIEEQTEEEFEDAQDDARFGFGRFDQGLTGSLSGSGVVTSGNTDTADFAIGGRLRYGAGLTNYSLGVAAFYGEEDHDRSENNVFVTADVNRSITEQFYLFALGRYEYDEFGPFEHDAFLGVGPGVRLYNTEQFAWRVQAGPGVRYTKDQDGEDETDFAVIASSRLFYSISETAFFTNDTDILHSDVGTQIINDAGVNFRLTDTLSTRVAYRTDWNSDPIDGFDETDNKLTVSVVYAFN
ncbi:DUF481 domain-containing protein [Roseitranquillus sediminis]|uniref:DUF481 domain-containing protein n=1 Tax=Roseitranquillus sediminis TaxID=2809051 RepID=UPI001D0C6245|nr:DUF481 domain-containing protein [Roseitranquillus sediminis]MBM9596144.1 DUF481 domain-containing protein [Roseitranquillus sediminis]